MKQFYLPFRYRFQRNWF